MLQTRAGMLSRVGRTGESIVAALLVAALTAAGYAQEIRRAKPLRQTVNVEARVQGQDALSPDPSERIVVREEAVEANPARPGVPLSIPGLPAETAAGGIKAPQYFAPGVAGDHGEPIAQYLQIGTYRVPNNLTANAHGNGYADPNIFIPETIESVRVDAGSFNVQEGNHAVDLAASYSLRQRTEPFFRMTGDYRDLDLMAGWSPTDPAKRFLIAVEAAAGDGLLRLREHRRQYKLTSVRQLATGNHVLTLAGFGYYGKSRDPGLVPLGAPEFADTIDPRQKDQTHSAALIVNDNWQISSTDALQLSAFFRSYNLSLFSNFGDGLIRQKEFRTVAGANTTYWKQVGRALHIVAGVDLLRDAPRGLQLDRYNNTTDFAFYGAFQTVFSNNFTFNSLTPFVDVSGTASKYVSYTLGWRRDFIRIDNQDLIGLNSYNRWNLVDSPKASVVITPPGRWLPRVAFSFGESFFVNDPRIGSAGAAGTLVNRSHAYQIVMSKLMGRTDVRLRVARVTSDQSLAKIDADTGLQQTVGPSRNLVASLGVRHYFSFGLLESSIAKADARETVTGWPLPEAPRLIFDALGTIDKLPFHLHFRGELEYVGRKPLGNDFASVPVREFRGSVVRSFRSGRIETGVNVLAGTGYLGQTLETITGEDGSVGSERIVGVRVRSYVSASVTYRFRRVD